ncbi:FixH family protein [Caldimonas brevitalea]|uniref:Nitrogen fixation protein FixH n=1 Tax=Caldimonas brevitalea TaxID=413882 RepID=A0A0G3BGT0_9BURK|nr:FixH family protein [Caldimonas brevitalea]AKJ28654.1 hypothetical protein AAW51_1963 [Caldimonas brevitalea]
MKTNLATASVVPASTSWWREPMMWLVVGGPTAVVLAGVATIVLAVTRPDPVLTEDYYRRGLEINKTLQLQRDAQAAAAAVPEALRPAMQARNHAATPSPDGQQGR